MDNFADHRRALSRNRLAAPRVPPKPVQYASRASSPAKEYASADLQHEQQNTRRTYGHCENHHDISHAKSNPISHQRNATLPSLQLRPHEAHLGHRRYESSLNELENIHVKDPPYDYLAGCLDFGATDPNKSYDEPGFDAPVKVAARPSQYWSVVDQHARIGIDQNIDGPNPLPYGNTLHPFYHRKSCSKELPYPSSNYVWNGSEYHPHEPFDDGSRVKSDAYQTDPAFLICGQAPHIAAQSEAPTSSRHQGFSSVLDSQRDALCAGEKGPSASNMLQELSPQSPGVGSSAAQVFQSGNESFLESSEDENGYFDIDTEGDMQTTSKESLTQCKSTVNTSRRRELSPQSSGELSASGSLRHDCSETELTRDDSSSYHTTLDSEVPPIDNDEASSELSVQPATMECNGTISTVDQTTFNTSSLSHIKPHLQPLFCHISLPQARSSQDSQGSLHSTSDSIQPSPISSLLSPEQYSAENNPTTSNGLPKDNQSHADSGAPVKGVKGSGRVNSNIYSCCTEPWAVSAIIDWLKNFFRDTSKLNRANVLSAIKSFCDHHLPTRPDIGEYWPLFMYRRMLKEQVLVIRDGELRFTKRTLTGVMVEMTGQGCYSARAHDHDALASRCYSETCVYRSENFEFPLAMHEDWHMYWSVPNETLAAMTKDERAYQGAIHEALTFAYSVCRQYRLVNRDLLAWLDTSRNPRDPDYLRNIFGYFAALEQVTVDYFLLPMVYRVTSEGPYVNGISDIMRAFMRKAKNAYTAAAAARGLSDYLFKRKRDRDAEFRNFTNDILRKFDNKRLDWSTIDSLCTMFPSKLGLLTESMVKSCSDDTEKAALELTAKEWVTFNHERNINQAKFDSDTKLKILNWKIRIQPPHGDCKLCLDDEQRRLIYDCEISFQSNNGSQCEDRRLIIFDNSTVIAKFDRCSDDTEVHVYSVDHMPMLTALVNFEYFIDPKQQTSTRLMSSFTKRTRYPASSEHLDQFENSQQGTSSYPCKMRLHGAGVVNMSLKTPADFDAIFYKLNDMLPTVPAYDKQIFRLKELRTCPTFTFPPEVSRDCVARRGMATYVADDEPAWSKSLRWQHVFTARINCAHVFKGSDKDTNLAIGTDNGLYISKYPNEVMSCTKVRRFKRQNITQIGTCQWPEVVLILADGRLQAYDLDLLNNPERRHSPLETFSGKGIVRSFCLGYTYVGDTNINRPCLLITRWSAPKSFIELYSMDIVQHTNGRETMRFSRILHEEQQLEAQRGDINFETLHISTPTGFHVYHRRNEKWQTEVALACSELYDAHEELYQQFSAQFAKVANKKALSTVKISTTTWLLAYEGCALKCGSTGAPVLYRYASRAKSVCAYGKYLIVICDDLIQILDASNGALLQIITGLEIELLDDGWTNYPHCQYDLDPDDPDRYEYGLPAGNRLQRTVKVSMRDPDHNDKQLLFELCLNEA